MRARGFLASNVIAAAAYIKGCSLERAIVPCRSVHGMLESRARSGT
jgi:hypothetical protein